MITLDGVGARARPELTPLLAAAIGFAVLAGVCTATRGELRDGCANIGSLLLAAGGSVGCLRAARRTAGRWRRGWVAMAVACGSWAAGQLAWTVLESVLDEAIPYPSVADIGYMGFPVAALAAFGLLAPPASRLQVWRRLLDALTVGAAITLVAWLVVLSSVTDGAASPVTRLVELAYPVGDVILLTIAALTFAQTRGRPDGWRRLAAGAAAMAYSDAAFAFLTARGEYTSGGPADWGWWAAFCLFGVAGVRVRPAPAQESVEPADQKPDGSGMLGYATIAVAVIVVVVDYGRGERFDDVAGVLTVLVVALVLVRQYVALWENRALTQAVQAREAQLHRLAFHDALTGLANRALFLDRLGHALQLAGRDQRPVSVIFCDLDGFKAVNDSLGHAMGDRLLVGVAERFRAVLRSTDTLARLGGDEFAALIEQAGDDRAVEVVAEAMFGALEQPFPMSGRTVSVSVSIGVATADPRRSPQSAVTLLHRADVAMYEVKASGRPGVRTYDPAADGAADGRAGGCGAGRHAARSSARSMDRPRTEPIPATGSSDTLADAFADALDRRLVRAAYQPVVDPGDGHISAVEALARWTHDGREIGPDVFVPMAERTGLSGTLASLMLENTCEQLGRWSRRLGHQQLRAAVNVSPADLTDAELPTRVERLVQRHGLGMGQLILEVTETRMWRPDEVLDVLLALRASGVRIAIDDFGTGYSSLSRLASLPLDSLKLDRIFVSDIDHDESRLQFLAGLLDLARHLGLRTIAEGVERPGQLLALRRLRCDLIQGYLTGYPMSADDLTPLLLADATMLPFGLQPAWRVGTTNPVLARP